jgi:hypothetical protein
VAISLSPSCDQSHRRCDLADGDVLLRYAAFIFVYGQKVCNWWRRPVVPFFVGDCGLSFSFECNFYLLTQLDPTSHPFIGQTVAYLFVRKGSTPTVVTCALSGVFGKGTQRSFRRFPTSWHLGSRSWSSWKTSKVGEMSKGFLADLAYL